MNRRDFARIAGFGSTGFALPPTARAQPGLRCPERGWITLQPAPTWEYALISGNGTLGAMVLGDPLDETIVLNHAQLFMPWEKPLPPVGSGSHLAEIRGLLAAGKCAEAVDLFMELSYQDGYGKRLYWTDPLIPAFDLRVSMETGGTVRRYARCLDFETGVVTVRWEDDRGEFRRRLFVSRPDNVVVLSISGARLNCRVSVAVRPEEKRVSITGEPSRFQEGIRNIDIAADAEWLTYRSNFKRGWPGSLRGYEGAGRVLVRGGTASADGKQISVQDAGEVIVLVRIDLSRDDSQPLAPKLKRELGDLPADFGTLLDRHAKVHSAVFNRVRLDLGGRNARDLPAEELLAKAKGGHAPTALIEKEFDYGRYAILSGTGRRPPTLQGIWNGTWAPPWSSDFTQNGNVQAAIASQLSGNMAELMLSYFSYLDDLMPDLRENARRLYGCRGIHIPSRTSTHGIDMHFSAGYPMTFWTAGAAWAAHFYYEYWLFTGDREFLAGRAVPFMKEAAAFYEDFLVEDKNGRLLFSPSYSAENTPRGAKSPACVNATMDISVAKELLTNLIAACRELGTDPEGIARWSAMLARMPEYLVNSDGALKEWAAPALEDDYTHRHASHLYALFDGMPPDVAASPRLQKAFARAIGMRMRERRRQNIGIMSFGLVQLGQAASTLRDSETSYQVVDWLAGRSWNSGAPWHHPGNTFGVDVCGGMPAVIIKMLLDSQPGLIDLLPALPAQWPAGKIEGLPCRGQVFVKSLAWDGSKIAVTLRSERARRITLRAPRMIQSLAVNRGTADIGAGSGDDSRFLSLPAKLDVALRITLAPVTN